MGKEYVLGNKAKSLLAYSLTVTKPTSDKTVQTAEMVGVLRQASSLPPAEAQTLMLKTAEALSTKRQKEGFPKSTIHTFVKEIQQSAVRILRNIRAANNCFFEKEYERRLSMIYAVLDDCDLLLALIEESQKAGYISIKRMEHWSKLVTDVKYMTLSWKNKDTERAETMRKKEKEADYQRQATVIAEALARVLYQNQPPPR